jgi:guanylate kinase
MSDEGNALLNPPSKPLLLVLSGLSGAGKDTVLDKLEESVFPAVHVITNTTREPRPNERDGEHYHFISADKFQQMRNAGELLESASVYGHWYGVPREPVRQALDGGKDVVIKVDVQGALTIKKIAPEAVFIFLAPPSIEELITRLRQRRTETEAEFDLRIKTANEELAQLSAFDYLVLNRQGEVDRTVADIRAIFQAEKCRVKPRNISL